MTVTRDQAQMLASLAVACRPFRAPTWDEAGILAAIGKVKERALADVALAVIRAAADRDAKTPGVIPTNGSHWQEVLKPMPWQPDRTPREERCGICAKPRERCEGKRTPGDDHTFEADVRRDPGIDVPATVEALRAEVVHAKAEPAPKPTLDELAANPNVQALRNQLATTPAVDTTRDTKATNHTEPNQAAYSGERGSAT